MKIVNKYDKFILGLITGIIIPLLVSGGVLLVQMYNKELTDDWKLFLYNIYPKIIGVSALVDLGVFYFFLNRKLNNAARGVIFAVFIFILYVIITKVF